MISPAWAQKFTSSMAGILAKRLKTFAEFEHERPNPSAVWSVREVDVLASENAVRFRTRLLSSGHSVRLGSERAHRDIKELQTWKPDCPKRWEANIHTGVYIGLDASRSRRLGKGWDASTMLV